MSDEPENLPAAVSLPIPLPQLPKALHRFADPNAPAPAKMMAARGMVPGVKGGDLITVLAQLSADPDEKIAKSAKDTVAGMPEGVLLPALAGEMLGPVLDFVYELHRKREDVLERLVVNPGIADHTLERIARECSENVTEVIAVNQQRLLATPKVVEALYKNKNTRMSTADRLIELCARNDVRLEGIPSFEAHVEAIQGQLIPEPDDEPLPADEMFKEALVEEERIAEEVEASPAEEDRSKTKEEKEEDKGKVDDRFKPLNFRISQMTTAEKLRLAITGGAAARGYLVRDRNRQVAHAAIASPSMTEAEAVGVAHSKEVSDDILRYIANKREWLRSYEMKRALIFNPKTPAGIAMRFLGHMRVNDLKELAKSRGVSNAVRNLARQRINKMSTRK